MEIFSIICLVVILITIQHLLNWGWRAVEERRDNAGLIFVATLISIPITITIIYHIILWGSKIL